MSHPRTKPLISLQQWRTLLAVVQEGGIHAAAKSIGRSHSAVSQSITRMEEMLDVHLLEAEGRSVKPTPIGLVLAKQAERLLSKAHALEQMAEFGRQDWEPLLRIGVDPAVPAVCVADVVHQWASESRSTQLLVQYGAIDARIKDWDLVLTRKLPKGVAANPWKTLHLLTVVSCDHALAKASSDVVSERLPETPRVFVWEFVSEPDNDGVGHWFVPDLQTAKAMLYGGEVYAMLPRCMVEHELASGRLVALLPKKRAVVQQLHVLYPKGADTGPAAQALGELFEAKE